MRIFRLCPRKSPSQTLPKESEGGQKFIGGDDTQTPFLFARLLPARPKPTGEGGERGNPKAFFLPAGRQDGPLRDNKF
jgi:hypothetical protein